MILLSDFLKTDKLAPEIIQKYFLSYYTAKCLSNLMVLNMLTSGTEC